MAFLLFCLPPCSPGERSGHFRKPESSFIWHNDIIREKIFKNKQQIGLESRAAAHSVRGSAHTPCGWWEREHGCLFGELLPMPFLLPSLLTSSFVGHDIQFLTYPWFLASNASSVSSDLWMTEKWWKREGKSMTRWPNRLPASAAVWEPRVPHYDHFFLDSSTYSPTSIFSTRRCTPITGSRSACSPSCFP